jgi:hypothetical protein
MRRRRVGLGFAALLAAGPAAAQVVQVERVDVIEAVPDVRGVVGGEIALTVRPSGRPIGAPVMLREVWRLPLPGIRNPETGAVSLEISSQFEVRLGDQVRRRYVFDQPWKILRGEWLIEYWDGVRKLLNRKFLVQ